MEEFGSKPEQHNHNDAGVSVDASNIDVSTENSNGSSVQESDLNAALAQSLTPAPDDHDHAPDTSGNGSNHVSLDAVSVVKTLSKPSVGVDKFLKDDIGKKGDLLNPGEGKNTVIGSGDADIILGIGGGFNTITTGTGKDTVILGAETTNRIFDFDPTKDRIGITTDLNINNIVVAQGKNPGKGGLDQPLDSVNNALVIDKATNHILAALTFTKASDLSNNIFKQIAPEALGSLDQVKFNVKQGGGQLTGTRGRDKMTGGSGDDFLYVGDDGFKTAVARGDGPSEFPFPNDSPGKTTLTANLKGGTLQINGFYRNFDGAPLFSQGERAIDKTAVILNGSDPQALIDGFLKVPQDSEGNKLSGTHLHFSPAGDSRGNFADATVERYLTNKVVGKKSGVISGEFELSPEEQAAYLAGNFYVNLHTNVDIDGDGKGGFPTGENRVNFNQKAVRFV